MEQESNLLEVIHFDVCSPMSAEARSGYHCLLTSPHLLLDQEGGDRHQSVRVLNAEVSSVRH